MESSPGPVACEHCQGPGGFLLHALRYGLARLQLGHSVAGLRFQASQLHGREMAGELLPLGPAPREGGWEETEPRVLVP